MLAIQVPKTRFLVTGFYYIGNYREFIKFKLKHVSTFVTQHNYVNLFWKLNLEVGNCISRSKVLFIKMIQLKVLKILSKTPLTKENKCQMLTQAINFCKFFFLEGVTTFRKSAISWTVEKMIPFQLVIFHLTFTPKCLDRKLRNKAACQRSHSNERHIIHPLSKMLLASWEVLKHRETKPLWLLWMIPNQIFNRIL